MPGVFLANQCDRDHDSFGCENLRDYKGAENRRYRHGRLFVAGGHLLVGPPLELLCELLRTVMASPLIAPIRTISLLPTASWARVTVTRLFCRSGGGVFPFNSTTHPPGYLDRDAHNPYGPTATPIIFSTMTIEGAGLRCNGRAEVRTYAYLPSAPPRSPSRIQRKPPRHHLRHRCSDASRCLYKRVSCEGW